MNACRRSLLIAASMIAGAQAADFSWDGEPGSANAQYGPSPAVWDSTTVTWIPGNTATGNATAAWVNATTSVAQFKSGTGGANPGTLVLTLGEDITANKIDLGGGFAANLVITNSGANTFGITLAGTTPALAPNGGADDLTVDVVISGAAGLTKLNAGEAVLTKANAYTGGTSISGGLLTAQNALAYGSGAVTVSGSGKANIEGALTVANDFILNGGSSSGAIVLSGGALTGTIDVAADSVIAAHTAASTLSGGISGSANLTFDGGGAIYLTGATSNALDGATILANGTLFLNKSSGANAIGGDVVVNGGVVDWNSANQVADTASITVNGGTIHTHNRADTIANLTIHSAGSSTFSGLTITDTLTVTAGTTHDPVNSGGTLTTNRADLSGGSNLRIAANGGDSTWKIGAGGLEMDTASIQFGQPGGSPAALLNLGGDFTGTGTNRFDAPNTNGPRSLDLQGGNRNFDVQSGVTTVEANVTVDNGGITKTGAGVLVLNGANTYTGGTIVNGGTLLLNGDQSGAIGEISVTSGATLGGEGTIGGATTIQSDGTLSPGNSPGVETFTSGLTLNTGSTFSWELVGNTDLGRGTNFDGVDVTGGTLTVQNGVKFDLILNSPSSTVSFADAFWQQDRSWLVFDNANAPALNSASIFDVGTMTQDSAANTLSPAQGSFSFRQSGNDVYLVFDNVAFVPEPATTGLLALLLGGWLAFFRPRRKW